MEQIYPTYKNPLNSIIIIVALALVIAIVSHGWESYKGQKNRERLIKFVDDFDTLEPLIESRSITYEPHMLKPLSLLAKAFERNGEYQKAISIYNYLIRDNSDDEMRLELTGALARVYLRAGFFKRAQECYLQVLKSRPRKKEMIKELGVVYEQMRLYEDATKTLEPLRELGVDIGPQESYLAFKVICDKRDILVTKRIKMLLDLLKKEPRLYREVFKKVAHIDHEAAWQIFRKDRFDEVVDVLYMFTFSQLDLDIISSDNRLKALYYIKGYTSDAKELSGDFAYDLLVSARRNGFKRAVLSFVYFCKECKGRFPVSFARCPSCMSIYSIKVEKEIGEQREKDSDSLL